MFIKLHDANKTKKAEIKVGIIDSKGFIEVIEGLA
jgi:hypothetical protein